MSAPALSENEAIFLGTVLEGFFYGLYCVIFVLYINLTKKAASTNRLKYPLTALFTLCSCFICLDFASEFILIFRSTSEKGEIASFGITVATDAMYACIDVISQSVLIYRCWVMWNRNPLFIVVPSILATTSFTLAMILTIKQLLLGVTGALPAWWFKMALASFSISLCVNTFVTALLVFKIIMLHREVVKSGPRTRGMYELRPLISIVIESGMFTFVAQMMWVIFVRLQSSGNPGFGAVASPTTIIYGITPTIVLVRAASGRSYDTTAVENTIELSDRRGHTDGSLTNVSFAQRSVNIKRSVVSDADYESDKRVL